MSALSTAIRDLQAAARRGFGRDITVVVARAPIWGNPDCTVVFSGSRHAAAAQCFARGIVDGKVQTLTGNRYGDGQAYEYSALTFAPKAAS